MDSSLAILFGGAAVFSGIVAYLVLRSDLGPRRAAAAAVGTGAAVAAALFVMPYLATVAYPALLGFVALFSGALAYLVFRHDFGARTAGLAGAGAAVVITAGFLVVVYFALLAFIGAAGVYLLLRGRFQLRSAILLTGTVFSGLLVASVFALWYSLTYTM